MYKRQVKEDSLPGRTTNINDMQDGSHLNGASVFKSCLLSHSPLDLIIIMLGTNDLKKRFNRSSDEVAKGVKELINIAKHTFSGKGTWHDQNLSEIVVICPPVLGELSNDLQWSNYIEWEGAFDKSKKLFNSLKHVTDEEKIYLIDSNQYIESSSLDPIHWSKKTHETFGKKVADLIVDRIKL